MQRILLLICTCFITIVTSPAIWAQEGGIGPGTYWVTYTVNDEEFSVNLPRSPAMMTTAGLRKEDDKRRRQRLLKTSLRGVDYSVETFENPEPRQSLEQFIAEHGSHRDFDAGTKRRLTIDGFAGMEYSSSNKASPVRVQFFATENHLYRFVASGPGADVELFFSSIKLGKKLDGKEVFDGSGSGLPIQSDTGERVFPGKEVDTKIRLLKKPEPTYTREALENKITGTVILRAVFSANGQVNNIRVVSGLPYGLTEQAMNAARGIKFTPATKDGKPVSMWIQLEYNFNP